MRLIRQYNEVDCGICVAAMVAGVSWSKAVAVDKHPESETGLSVSEFVAMCGDLGKRIKVSKSQYKKLLYEVTFPAGVVALLVRPPLERIGHFVAVDGKYVLDPDTGRHLLAKYVDQRIELVRMFLTA